MNSPMGVGKFIGEYIRQSLTVLKPETDDSHRCFGYRLASACVVSFLRN